MEWSYPWLDMDGDRTYDDGDFAKFYANLFSTGVSLTTNDGLRVVADSGMKVAVKSGAANIEGRSYLNSAALPLDIPVASSTQDRTDSVVVRMNKALRSITIIVKQGDIDVTRTSDVYELQLAQIKVAKNTSEIKAANITDKRADDKVCGFSSPFQKVNVSGLESQYSDFLKQAFESFKASVSSKEIDFDAEIKRIIGENSDVRTEELAIFKKWFDSIKAMVEGLENGEILTELMSARTSVNGTTYATIGERLNDELFSIEGAEILSDESFTLIDNDFSRNHSVKKIGSVETVIDDLPIVMATIDDVKQNTFMLSKVGEV